MSGYTSEDDILEAQRRSLLEASNSNKRRREAESNDNDLNRALQLSLRGGNHGSRSSRRFDPNDPSSTWNDSMCDVVTTRTDVGVLESSGETVKVDFTRTYSDTREFSLHNVPGDGSCFFHAAIEAMRKSSHLWRSMVNPSPLPGGPRTFCDFVVKWWAKYVTTIPDVVSEDNVHEHLNFKFLRYITAESITDEEFNGYKDITTRGVSRRRYFSSKSAMKEAIMTERGYFADDFTIVILNKVLSPFIKIAVVRETSNGSLPPIHSVIHDNNRALSYMWVLLRGQHYYLMRKTGPHKPRDNSFLEMIPSRDNVTLKYLRQDWC